MDDNPQPVTDGAASEAIAVRKPREPRKIFPPIDRHEWYHLLNRLERAYSVFATLFSITRPVPTDKIPTAAVCFNKAGNCIDFLINPDFWAKQSMDQKEFIMSHEAFHVFLNHGVRMRSAKPHERAPLNAAMDIVINHTLVDKLDFNRHHIDPPTKELPGGQLCWRDTVFKGAFRRRAKPGQNFEFYFNLLKQQMKADGYQEPTYVLINDHSQLESFLDKDGKGLSKQMKDLIKRNFNHGELKEFEEVCKEAGIDPGDLTKTIEEMLIVPKRKWETIIKEWASQFNTEAYEDQFIRTNRRYTMMPREDFFLPTESDCDGRDKHRVDVWFFLDSSGSCVHLADRFFKAALSMPEDRFNVKLFCFDTKVYEVDPVKRQLFGFGGTDFQCIDQYVRSHMPDNGGKVGSEKAPFVWVVTDGYGSHVAPEKPERWHWFLSDAYEHYIPEKSRRYMLANFE